MGDPYKGKLAGHSLQQGGFAVKVWPHRRGMPTFAVCECGARSEKELASVEDRRAWHRQHKADKLDDFVARGCDDRGREVHL